MPGFGHLLLGQYVVGWLLFVWEVVINVQSHFNVAILYSFTGRFHDAAQILKSGHITDYWILAYGAVFTFALYDSFKKALETNELYGLAQVENAPLATFMITQTQYNYLAKRNPFIGALWSLLIPGIGAIYTHRVLTALFEIGWWTTILIKSHVLSSIEYTAIGDFHRATSVLNPQWTLYLPSMFVFPCYYTFVITVERNKLFDKEQANYLIQNYQNRKFPLHIKDGKHNMRFIATFQHSIYLEKAISALESLGVLHEDIFVTPLNKQSEKSPWFKVVKRADGKNFMELITLLGAVGCFFGTVYGFVLYWGPVIWGLIGFASGSCIGVIIKTFAGLAHSKNLNRVPNTEVVLIVDCETTLAHQTEDILWSNYAIGISRIPNQCTISD